VYFLGTETSYRDPFILETMEEPYLSKNRTLVNLIW